LRERSKARRRRAIQLAALHLFAERGYDGATIADIAEEAEVAPRTISMYFPTKLDIAMSVPGDIATALTGTFQRYPELGFVDVIDRWLRTDVTSMDSELTPKMTAMFDANPGLRAVSTHITEAAAVGRSALMEETGLRLDDPMLAIVGASIGAAISEHMGTALTSDVTPAHHEAFIRYLRALIAAAASI
jgi:AcrR family transcriptional regulator